MKGVLPPQTAAAPGTTLVERYSRVRERIERAATRCHRDPESILLLAVTKKFPAEAIREAYVAGMREFGENYVQEFELKHPALADLGLSLADPSKPIRSDDDREARPSPSRRG